MLVVDKILSFQVMS